MRQQGWEWQRHLGLTAGCVFKSWFLSLCVSELCYLIPSVLPTLDNWFGAGSTQEGQMRSVPVQQGSQQTGSPLMCTTVPAPSDLSPAPSSESDGMVPTLSSNSLSSHPICLLCMCACVCVQVSVHMYACACGKQGQSLVSILGRQPTCLLNSLKIRDI